MLEVGWGCGWGRGWVIDYGKSPAAISSEAQNKARRKRACKGPIGRPLGTPSGVPWECTTNLRVRRVRIRAPLSFSTPKLRSQHGGGHLSREPVFCFFRWRASWSAPGSAAPGCSTGQRRGSHWTHHSSYGRGSHARTHTHVQHWHSRSFLQGMCAHSACTYALVGQPTRHIHGITRRMMPVKKTEIFETSPRLCRIRLWPRIGYRVARAFP